MYAPERRVHFAPVKTVYSAPHVLSSDTLSIASSPSPSSFPGHLAGQYPEQLGSHAGPSPLLGSSPASASSAELSTPPPAFGFGRPGQYGTYDGGHYVPQPQQQRYYQDAEAEAAGRRREEEGQPQGWYRQELPPGNGVEGQRYQYLYSHSHSPSQPYAQPQYVLDQPSETATYPRTPFTPAAELETYSYPSTYPSTYPPSTFPPAGYSPQPAFAPSPSPSFTFSPLPASSSPYLEPKPLTPRTIHIHYLLAYTPHNPHASPAFTCDLSRPPPHLADAYARFHSGQPYRDSKFDVLHEPATSPPMNSIVITHPRLKFTIDVCAGADTSRVRPRALGHIGRVYDDSGYGSSSSSSDEGDPRIQGQGDDFVTVADVLVCLYRELRLAIHPVEYAELAPDVVHSVNKAYFARCASLSRSSQSNGASRLAGGVDEDDDDDWVDAGTGLEREVGREVDRERERIAEEKKGIRKIDLLMGQTWFVGLSGTLHGPGVWELNVAT